MRKIIFTGFSPNLEKRDVFTALSFLFLPWKWVSLRNGAAVQKSEEKLKDYFSTDYAFAFDSGRSALYFALKALGASSGDEVLVQAYTCVVVSNAITWTGCVPVYVDIGNDFNMDPADLEKKITNKSKVLIIQHTFGMPAKLDELLAIAKKHGLMVIEDCAHSSGAKYKGKLTGTFGNIGMLSFGSDKVLSCVRGGALIVSDDELASKIADLKDRLKPMSIIKIIQHLLHYPVFYIAKPTYGIILGKLILAITKYFHIVNRITYTAEKKCKQLKFYPSLLPNSLANILLAQLSEVDTINRHRRSIAKIYNNSITNEKIKFPLKDKNECIYLRYPILSSHADQLFMYFKNRNIILGMWYDSVIAPKDIKLERTGYKKGTCPNAEFLAEESLNLPTNRHVSETTAAKIVNMLNSF